MGAVGVRVVLALILATIVAVTQVLPVNAYRLAGKVGKPGNVATVYRVNGLHWDLCQGMELPYPLPPGFFIGEHCLSPMLTQRGPGLTRSKARKGKQVVVSEHTYQRWDATTQRWVFQTRTQHAAVITKGERRVAMPDSVVWPTSGRAYYRVLVTVTWLHPRSERVLGQRTVRMVSQGDYRCATSMDCSSGPGWICVGGFYGERWCEPAATSAR